MTDAPTIHVDRFEARVQWGSFEAVGLFLRDDGHGCYYGVSENPDEAGKLCWQVPQNTDGRRPVPRMVTPLDEREVPHDTKRHLSQAWEG